MVYLDRDDFCGVVGLARRGCSAGIAIRVDAGTRYQQGCLVDCRRQLFEPVCRRHSRSCTYRRNPIKGRLAHVAAAQLNLRPEDLCFAGGRVFAASNPENSLSFARVAAASHWYPDSLPDPARSALRETVFWSPATLEPPNMADEINSSAVYGFVFDFCGIEVDRDTGVIRVDKYVSLHDAGRILNPALLDGQVRGGFAMAIGAALYERFVYVDDGGFLTGSFADYAVPTASMIPELEILHMESPSPVTPLGAKGVAEGNAMSTPVCIANAIADALGVAEISVPLTPERRCSTARCAAVLRWRSARRYTSGSSMLTTAVS